MDQLVNERQNTADLLAAALTNDNQEPLDFDRGQSLQSTDALQSLLATAAEGEDVIEEYEDDLAILPVRQQPERPQQPPRGRTRRPPGVPRRSQRPRDNDEKGQRLPNETRDRETVNTVERYSHTNEDGSFTFGYIAEDGSFREETRGVDCITRGKYGYIDPDGKKREFTYVSGLPCDITDEENAGVSNEDLDSLQREDPISPNDRFRTSPAVQLDDDEIPDSARPRQRIPANEARPAFEQQQPQQQSNFPAFQQRPQQEPTRVRDPALRNRGQAQPGSAGALQNLLNIVNDQEAAPVQPARRPRPTEAPAVTRPRPQPATPRPTARPSAFDFDSALDSFTLGKPAITFDDAREQERNNAEEAAPQPAGPNFSTELVFDPASGTFKTELRQALPNGDEVRVSDDAAPAAGASPRPEAPTPLPAAQPSPFTAFQSSLAPTPRPASPRPTAAASPQSNFEPLTFPSPAPTTPTPRAPESPAPASPTTLRPASPSPTGSFFFQPFPTVGSPRPLSASPSPTPSAAPSPFPSSPAPAQPQQTRVPSGTFISFGGPSTFGQGRPSPFQGATQPQQPFSVFNTPRPAAPAPSPQPSPSPSPSPAPRQPSPSPSPSPAPRPASPSPPAASPVTPQVQFGFQPIQQVQPQQPPRPQPQAARPQFAPQQAPGRPFTAFASGTPPQLNGAPQSQFQARPPTTFFGQPQLGIPPQVQQQQQRPLGIPPQLQQGQQPGGRFQPFGRPPPQQAQRPQGPPQQQQPSAFSPFAVFNPAALRGARFF